MDRTVLFALLSFAACRLGAAPGEGTIRIDASIGRSTITVGDTTSAVFRLRNTGPEPVTLGFSSACQVLPYVAAGPAGDVVYPGGGDWGCAAVITSLTLAAGGEKTVTVLLRGGAGEPIYPEVRLAPGAYRIFARLGHPYEQQSNTLALTVK